MRGVCVNVSISGKSTEVDSGWSPTACGNFHGAPVQHPLGSQEQDLTPAHLPTLSSSLNCLPLAPPPLRLRPEPQAHAQTRGATRACISGSGHRLSRSPPPFPPAPQEGGLRLVRKRLDKGRGRAAPGTGSRERPARDLVAPPPCPLPPGLWLQRQPRAGLPCGGGGSPASAPAPLGAPRPRPAATPALAARLGRRRSPGLTSAPPAPGPPPMGPG